MTKSSRDPAFEPPTAEELAQWALDDAANDDHYYQVPARDRAERAAYDDIERIEAELAEAREYSHHFDGQPGQVAPHEYQCDDGCVYETDAARAARINREEEFDRLRAAEDQHDLATSYPTFDDDPALWGLRTEPYASQAGADAAELLELWGPDGPPASYAAYIAEVEADREAGS